MLEKSFGLFYYLKQTKTQKKDKKYVYLRITVDGERKDISLKRQWDTLNWNTEFGRALNSLAQRQSQKISQEEKEKAAQTEFALIKKRLLKAHEVLALTISNYELYVFALTTPIVRRMIEPVRVNQNFHFQDLQDLFEPTFFEAAPDDSSVKLYFRRQSELTNEIKAFLLSTELTPWPDAELACREILINCSHADIAGTIAGHEKSSQEKQVIVNIIRSYAGQPAYAEGANLINAYVALYKVVKQNLVLIEKYNATIIAARL